MKLMKPMAGPTAHTPFWDKATGTANDAGSNGILEAKVCTGSTGRALKGGHQSRPVAGLDAPSPVLCAHCLPRTFRHGDSLRFSKKGQLTWQLAEGHLICRLQIWSVMPVCRLSHVGTCSRAHLQLSPAPAAVMRGLQETTLVPNKCVVHHSICFLWSQLLLHWRDAALQFGCMQRLTTHATARKAMSHLPRSACCWKCKGKPS